MSKFNVGDRVKVVEMTDSDPEFRVALGHVGAIKEVMSSIGKSSFRYVVDGIDFCIFEEELQSANDP